MSITVQQLTFFIHPVHRHSSAVCFKHTFRGKISKQRISDECDNSSINVSYYAACVYVGLLRETDTKSIVFESELHVD